MNIWCRTTTARVKGNATEGGTSEDRRVVLGQRRETGFQARGIARLPEQHRRLKEESGYIVRNENLDWSYRLLSMKQLERRSFMIRSSRTNQSARLGDFWFNETWEILLEGAENQLAKRCVPGLHQKVNWEVRLYVACMPAQWVSTDWMLVIPRTQRDPSKMFQLLCSWLDVVWVAPIMWSFIMRPHCRWWDAGPWRELFLHALMIKKKFGCLNSCTVQIYYLPPWDDDVRRRNELYQCLKSIDKNGQCAQSSALAPSLRTVSIRLVVRTVLTWKSNKRSCKLNSEKRTVEWPKILKYLNKFLKPESIPGPFRELILGVKMRERARKTYVNHPFLGFRLKTKYVAVRFFQPKISNRRYRLSQLKLVQRLSESSPMELSSAYTIWHY